MVCNWDISVLERSDEEQRLMKWTITGAREKNERIHLDGYALKSKVELLNRSIWGTAKDARGWMCALGLGAWTWLDHEQDLLAKQCKQGLLGDADQRLTTMSASVTLVSTTVILL